MSIPGLSNPYSSKLSKALSPFATLRPVGHISIGISPSQCFPLSSSGCLLSLLARFRKSTGERTHTTHQMGMCTAHLCMHYVACKSCRIDDSAWHRSPVQLFAVYRCMRNWTPQALRSCPCYVNTSAQTQIGFAQTSAPKQIALSVDRRASFSRVGCQE